MYLKGVKGKTCEGYSLHLALIRLFINVHDLCNIRDDLARKKPDSFGSGFLLFGAFGALRSRMSYFHMGEMG
ncbi:hypothetical protein L1077_04175, partial [Pseudoalteromonas luteoviolacea]|uniref:hypothetical protein n=1 Tax=Pseudoalteromonas luteoviolacea TaxID=43657 RepID=UPI001F2998A6